MARRPANPGPDLPSSVHTFPRPVAGFVGRRAELDRLLRHAHDEMLFLVYGVGGIGKTELVLQLIRELLGQPEWRDATPIHVDLRPGATGTRTLAQLFAASGAAPEPRRGQPTAKAHLNEQLAALARLFDERPYLLFIDNVHHLPTDRGISEALDYFSRHVHRSRLFVTSRVQMQLPANSAPPVVTTLGPLDAIAAETLMDRLAERMQVPRPDPEQMMRATHGSPFHIRRMLVGHPPDEGSLDHSFSGLSAEARRLLLAVSLVEHRPTLEAMTNAWQTEGALDETVRELSQRFLLDVESSHAYVHDLVSEPLLSQASAAELDSGHLDAAALCLAELRMAEPPSPIHAVDAIAHYMTAKRWHDAWRVVEEWHPALGAAGSDHLLLEPLERLRVGLPAVRVEIDLLITRCLVRMSLIEKAAGVLSRIGDAWPEADEARYCKLAGEVAQRRGQLAEAEKLFARAVACAPDEGARFHARLQVATVAVFGGDSGRGRGLLTDALADLATPTPKQRARCAWVRTVSWIFEERYERSAREARQARDELEGTGYDDLISRLAMLETLASIEGENMEHAREASKGIDPAGLRQHVAAFYRALLSLADGETRDASAALIDAYEYLQAHGDTINAYLAAHYGSKALATIGKLGRARALAEGATRLARSAGVPALSAQALALQALLAAEAVQSGAAHQRADEALSWAEQTGPRSQANAHCAHAHAYAIEGDIAAALDEMAHASAALAAPEFAGARAAVDIEYAAVHLVGGDLERAAFHAERAVVHYQDRSLDFETARAQLVLAGTYIARGRRADILAATQTVARARELGDRGELRSIQVGCAVLRAALARRGLQKRAADDLLAEALSELDPERGSLYASVLTAAIEGGIVAWAVPGVVALLSHLGFTEAIECYLVDRSHRRAASRDDAKREARRRELFVDEMNSVILAKRGEVEIRGRPMQCALLSEFVRARGAAVPPDKLYERVWGVAEYHPLNHRNALYVAINRLRKTLQKALPGREVIVSASPGWRLADDVDACAAVAIRHEPVPRDAEAS